MPLATVTAFPASTGTSGQGSDMFSPSIWPASKAAIMFGGCIGAMRMSSAAIPPRCATSST